MNCYIVLRYILHVGLLLGIKVLALSDNLSKALQAAKLSAVEAQKMASKTLTLLSTLRTEQSLSEFQKEVNCYREKLSELKKLATDCIKDSFDAAF